MISDQKILQYIKMQGGLNDGIIEIQSEDLLSYFKIFTLSEFSRYIPDVQEFSINTKTQQKVGNKKNSIYIQLPLEYAERELLNISEVRSSSNVYALFGHDITGLHSFEGLQSSILNNIQQNMQYKNSTFNFTYQFKHPNILTLNPFQSDEKLYIKQEITHSQDFSSIPLDYEFIFLDLQLQDQKIMIGRKRKKYENMETPFGQIQINTEILDEGMNSKREILDELKTQSNMVNIFIDVD